MGGLVSKGIGRSVQELINIRKKIKTIGKIAEEQVKRANAKNGKVVSTVKNDDEPKGLGKKVKDEVLASVLFQVRHTEKS